jgi:hypothetical protein
MARNTFSGYIRQHGSRRKGDGANPAPTPAPVPSALVFEFDPTAASAGTGKILPKGARVLEVLYNGAATGGASPTFDIGVTGSAAALVNEGDADAGVGRTVVMGAAQAADIEIVAGVGASAATGGTVTAAVVYVMDDDGALNS